MSCVNVDWFGGLFDLHRCGTHQKNTKGCCCIRQKNSNCFRTIFDRFIKSWKIGSEYPISDWHTRTYKFCFLVFCPIIVMSFLFLFLKLYSVNTFQRPVNLLRSRPNANRQNRPIKWTNIANIIIRHQW